jgi:paraquat-inducible protein B
MSQNASLSAIGGLVILGLALVVFAVRSVAFFPGSIRGVKVGAVAEFRGGKVGEVTDIRMVYSVEDMKYDVPVFFEYWPDKVTTVEGQKITDIEQASDEELINVLGLRARLDTKSFVTGQQAVSLAFRPDTPVRLSGYGTKGYYQGHFEIPPVESKFERISRKFEDLDLAGLVDSATRMFVAAEKLAGSPDTQKAIQNLRLGIQDARTLIESAKATVDEVRPAAIDTLKQIAALKSAEAAINEIRPVSTTALKQAGSTLKTVDTAIKEIKPASVKAIKQVDATLKTAQNFIDKDSSTRHKLERALAYRVGIDILRMEGQLGGDVVLLSRWIISSGDGKKVLVSTISRIVESTGTDDYEAYVEAQSRTPDALSREIAAAMKAKMK